MDRIDRRGFLECMAWAGSGLVWIASGGVLSSRAGHAGERRGGRVRQLQLRADQRHAHRLQGPGERGCGGHAPAGVDRINALQPAPAFVLHTGDQTHGQKPGAFDTVAEMLKGVKTERIFYVPGEHDVFLDGGKEYLDPLRQGHRRRARLAELRLQGHALRRPRQRAEVQGRGHGRAG